MRTVLEFDVGEKPDLPDKFSNHVCFSREFVEFFLEQYSDEGDNVIDIFAGFGTTVEVAEDLERNGYGLEFEKERADYSRTKLSENGVIVCGNALRLEDYDLPKFDLCITSPPFMAEQMETNPLENYSGQSNYNEYLDSIERIFEKLSTKMKDDSYVIVEVSNMIVDDQVTTLAWDIAGKVRENFHFEKEIIIEWRDSSNENNRGNFGYDHSYALVFRKEPEE